MRFTWFANLEAQRIGAKILIWVFSSFVVVCRKKFFPPNVCFVKTVVQSFRDTKGRRDLFTKKGSQKLAAGPFVNLVTKRA